MDHRPLGRTGVSVSKLCLGTMMFGSWGNPDHDECISIIHARSTPASTSSTPPTSTAPGESEEIVGKALKGRRDDIVLATKFHSPMGEDPNHRGNSRRWIMRAVEDSLRRLGTDWIDLYQIHRLRPTPTSTRRSPRSATSSTRARSATSATRPSRPAIVEAQWVARERAPGALRLRTTHRTRSSLARSRSTCCRPASATAWESSRTARSPAAGSPAASARTPPAGRSRARQLPDRFDLSCRSTNASSRPSSSSRSSPTRPASRSSSWRSRSSLNHPGVTAAIIGPRTMEHLEAQLAAADVVLDDAVLDRIDEIAPPGVTLNPVDNSFQNPALEPAARRRRASTD